MRNIWLACAKPWIQLPVTTPPQKTKTTKNQPQTNHFIVSSLNVLCILGLHIYTQSTYCLFYNFLTIWCSNTFSFGVIENFMISYHFTMYTCFTTNIFLPQMFDTNTHMHIYMQIYICPQIYIFVKALLLLGPDSCYTLNILPASASWVLGFRAHIYSSFFGTLGGP